MGLKFNKTFTLNKYYLIPRNICCSIFSSGLRVFCNGYFHILFCILRPLLNCIPCTTAHNFCPISKYFLYSIFQSNQPMYISYHVRHRLEN